MLEIDKEMHNGNEKISNLEKLISVSLKNLTKLSTVWTSSKLAAKRILQRTLFPEGIFYNREKHQDLTRNVNRFVELVSSISNSCEENKKRNSQKNLKIPIRYREADLNCRPQGYESCALTN